MEVDHASAEPGNQASSSSTHITAAQPIDGSQDENASSSSSEAGPSRRRSSSSHRTRRASQVHAAPTPSTPPASRAAYRHASPETALSPNRPSTPHLDLATYPTTTLLRLLASLLQQIATSNDQLRPEFEDEDEDMDMSHTSESRSTNSLPHPSPTTALFDQPNEKPHASLLDEPLPLFSASRVSLSHPSSLLSFHARHVPSISIEAYLLRILKYCPTTNEVFLGLLVYFDRMSRLGTPAGVGGEAAGAKKGIGRGFAIDSYNVHRLVIAGVTVASKFFSDVFYTNSRYAKVGGLPSHELNQLELQFLLLNDFRLVIPPDEMQRYGDRLLGYWESREAEVAAAPPPPQPSGMEVEAPETRGRSSRPSVSDAAATESASASTSRQRSSTTQQSPTRSQSQPHPQRPIEHRSNSTIAQPIPTPVVATAPRHVRDSKPASPSVSFAEPSRPRHGTSGGVRNWASNTTPGAVSSGGEAVVAE